MTDDMTTGDPTPGDPGTGGPAPELLARCAELKEELVGFACGPRYGRALEERRRAAEADSGGRLSESDAISLVEGFIFAERLEDGRTVVEAFVASRRPALDAADSALLLGWRDIVEGWFELLPPDGDTALLHNLFDDLTYRAHATRGPETFGELEQGTFLLGRLVPLLPFSDDWLVSGHLVVLDREVAPMLAQAALQALAAQPALMRHNPALWAKAWEIQAAERAAFVAEHGEHLVLLPPEAARAALPAGAEPPEGFAAAGDVGLLYDGTEGLLVYPGAGRLEELFADPKLAADRARITVLGEFLRDATVSPALFRDLAARHPDGADAAFRVLLGKRGFSWARDGEALLRRYKPAYFDVEPSPRVYVVCDRLRELLTPAG